MAAMYAVCCISNYRTLSSDTLLCLCKTGKALVDELDEAQREEFCKSDPSGTFRYNQATRRVGCMSAVAWMPAFNILLAFTRVWYFLMRAFAMQEVQSMFESMICLLSSSHFFLFGGGKTLRMYQMRQTAYIITFLLKTQHVYS
jgi:hypothetical protein